MKFSSMVPSQDLRDKSGLGALNFEVAVSGVFPQKVRNESRTENGQVKKGSRLESMLPSMAPLLLQKKLNQRADQSMRVQ